jgi:hypothetical protein
MLPQFLVKPASAGRWGLPCLLAVTLAGCQREEIRVYEAPKDGMAREAVGNDPLPQSQPAIPRPEVTWKMPVGWRQIPANQISTAAFSVTNADGAEAQASITLLPGMGGMETKIINMWREQTGLEALTDEAALKQLQPVAVGAEQGHLYEVSGTNETVDAAGQKKQQPLEIISAFLDRPEGSWFFKISGDTAMVASQKPVFLEFLKSIQFKAPVMGQPVQTTAESAETQKFNWTVPSNWKTAAPGQMQVARFSVTQNGQQVTEVFVSVFGNDTGGMLANVNRWRKLVDLTNSIAEAEMPQITAPLDASLPGALLVDVANNNKRLVGAIVPREGKYWFYRMLGEPAALSAEKEPFKAFVKSKP